MDGLIVSDVDGTLLPRGAAQVPQQTLDTLSSAAAQGYAVAVASGRAHAALHGLFGSIAEALYFICSDGAVLTHQGRLLYSRPIPGGRLADVCDKLRQSGRTAVLDGLARSYLLCGAEGAPRIDGQAAWMPVQNPMEAGEPIYKIAVYGRPLLDYPSGLRRAYQDAHWQEWVAMGADKGAAVAALQRALGLCQRTTAVFGDGENDLGMFRRAAYRCAMRTACPQLKAIANHTAANADAAVRQYIRRRQV